MNTPAFMTANINCISIINGTNFRSWQGNFLIVLGVMTIMKVILEIFMGIMSKRIKDKEAADTTPQKKQQKKPDEQKGNSCFFCGAEEHKRKYCKGMLLNLVSSEVNLTSVPRHTWWLDSGATTHISVSLQGCLSYRKPNDAER